MAIIEKIPVPTAFWTEISPETRCPSPFYIHRGFKVYESFFRDIKNRTREEHLALSFVGFAHAESLEGTDLLTELFDAHYHTGKRDLARSDNSDRYSVMLENKAANHFEGAINSWVKMNGRNEHIIYRLSKAADAYLHRYLLGESEQNLRVTRSYLDQLKTGLQWIPQDHRERNLVDSIIQTIERIPLPIQ